MLALHPPHAGERRLEAQPPRVAGVDAGDHGVDQHVGGLAANAPAGEVVARLVGGVAARGLGPLEQHAHAAWEAQDVAREKPGRLRR